MKYLINLLFIALLLTVTACSSDSFINAGTQDSDTKYTENTEMTQAEIKEIKELELKLKDKIASETTNLKSFNIKTAQEGKDVSIDMLLFHPKAAGRAKFWGIKNANKLAYAGSSPTKRWFLYRKLGGLFPSYAFKSQVMFWVERADLLRIPSVSLDDSFLLVMAGVTSVQHLSYYNHPIEQSALQVQVALLAFQYGLPIPGTSKVEQWTQQATTVQPVIY